MTMEKAVFILRGVPGCGKSTLTDYIAEPKVVCCADDYHMKNGVYDWKPENVGKAHQFCREVFDKALHDKTVTNVIVANTNIKSSDYKYYVDEAAKVGAKVFFLIVENRHGGVNTHNVPEETLDRMDNTLKQNIKLR